MLAMPVQAQWQRNVIVGIYPNEPMVFQDEKGQARGIFVELLEHVAAQEGWQLYYVYGTWAQQLQHLKKGETDLLLDIAYSKKRAAFLDFNAENVMLNWSQVFVHPDSGIQSILDLKGKKVALVPEDIHSINFLKLIDKFEIESEIVEGESYSQVLQMVEAGQVEAGVGSRLFGMYNSGKFDVIDSSIIFDPIDLRFASPKGKNEGLLRLIDHHLSLLKEDKKSLYYRSLNNWFGPEVSGIPKWVYWGGGGIVVLLIVFVVTTVIQRRLVNRRNEQLAAMHEAEGLRKEMERISRHDMKSPLNGVIGFADHLLADPDLSADHLESLHHIRECGFRLLDMVNLSLHLYKMEQGSYSFEPRPVDLVSVIFGIFDDNKSLIRQKKLVSRLSVAGVEVDRKAHFWVLGEEILCFTLLANLIKNAMEASPTEQTVSISMQNNATALIEIHNQGVVPEEIRERFFEKFVTFGKKNGIGVGTYSARLMALTQGGDIWMVSEDASGTTLMVSLPLVPQAYVDDGVPLFKPDPVLDQPEPGEGEGKGAPLDLVHG
ncbi:MAG: transporter substrate-binding domain-containing protein [Magnetococcales bacterium]|nr:transporter substrate-binding domain-containing protein [Magnetococcales bacterium]